MEGPLRSQLSVDREQGAHKRAGRNARSSQATSPDMSTTPLTPSAPPHYGPYVRSGSSGDVGGTSSRSNSGGEDQLSSNSGHSLEGSMTATKPPLTTTGPNHYYGSDAGTHASSSTASEGTVAAGESSRGTHGGRGGSITSTTGTTVSGGLNSPPLSPSRPHLTKWDENHVKAWLASVNCAQYGTSFEGELIVDFPALCVAEKPFCREWHYRRGPAHAGR